MRLPQQIFRWALGSGLSFTVNLGLAVLLHEVVGVGERAAYFASLVVVFVMNFLVQRYYVFDGRGMDARRQFAMFLGSSLAFRGIEYLSFLAIMAMVSDAWYAAIIAAVSVASLIVKFFFYRAVVFCSLRQT